MIQKQKRLVIVFSIEILLTAIILIQYSNIMLFSAADNNNVSGKQWNERGSILDRNASIIAIQAQRDTLLGWKPEIKDIDNNADFLAKLLHIDRQDIIKRITNSQGNIIIKRTISPEASKTIAELKKEGELVGFYLQPDKRRIYPENEVASHVVGYVGLDNVGLNGIEYTFNKELSSAPELPFGNHVYISIDINVQRSMEEIAQEALEREDARYVALIVMDARTGEILAFVNHPGFDPNQFTQYSDEERKNRLIADVYEPGSVFKIFSIASLLEMGYINGNTVFDASKPYVSPGGDFTIRDIGNYGLVDIEDIIKFSSNVGTAYAAEQVVREDFYYKLKQFGFGNKTGIELNGEEVGILKQSHQWSGRSRQTIAIGQEIGITALQIVTAATAFANDGMILKPTIIRKIVSPRGELLYRSERTVLRSAISSETSKQMLRMMHSSTEDDGTARRLQIDGIAISAKTGTAEVYDNKKRAYSQERFIASTLAIVPTKNPELIVYVAIHEPRAGEIYGGRIAAPVVKDALQRLIAERVLRHPDSQTILQENNITIQNPRIPSIGESLPDFSGLPKRSLLYLFKQNNIQVQIIGNGWVVRQSPAAGSPVTPDMELVLELE